VLRSGVFGSEFLPWREIKLISKFYRGVLILAALGAFVDVPMVNAHPSPLSNVREAIDHAKQAVAHGKEGHAEELVKHAETSLQFAKMGGRGSHLSEGIDHLNEAIEHGKAGHADVGTEHVEAALQHLLSEIE
jgi:hypothetical protein